MPTKGSVDDGEAAGRRREPGFKDEAIHHDPSRPTRRQTRREDDAIHGEVGAAHQRQPPARGHPTHGDDLRMQGAEPRLLQPGVDVGGMEPRLRDLVMASRRALQLRSMEKACMYLGPSHPGSVSN